MRAGPTRGVVSTCGRKAAPEPDSFRHPVLQGTHRTFCSTEHYTCESVFHPECFVCICAGGFMQLQCFHARTVHKCVCLCLTHRQGPAAWPGILRFGELYGCVRVRRPLPPAPACGCGCAAPTYGCVRVRVQAHCPPPAPACGCGALTYGCVRVRVTTGAGDRRVRRPARTRIHP